MNCLFNVQIYELFVQVYELFVQIYKLFVQVHALQDAGVLDPLLLPGPPRAHRVGGSLPSRYTGQRRALLVI